MDLLVKNNIHKRSALLARYPTIWNRWWTQSALLNEGQLGAGHCQYLIGLMYQEGFSSRSETLITKDYTKARYWLEQAEKNGHPDAQQALTELANEVSVDTLGALMRMFGGSGGASPSDAHDRAVHEKTETDRAMHGAGVPGYQGQQ